ncbi:hypothetical protein, partial [Rubrivirga sp.]|uniref:hypothetical protein n=1 Tax=Rubrivirga sp. TaxID=1885344 RepID=UPI003C753F36
MSDLSLRLDLYPDLSPEDRAALDLEVAGRPDLEDAHADAKRLAAILDAALATDADLEAAERVFDRRTGRTRLRQISADPEVRAQTRHLEDRFDELARDARDPVAHYEQLSGRSRPSRTGLVEGDGAAPTLRLVDLEVAPPPRRARWAPRLVAAVAILAVGYGEA